MDIRWLWANVKTSWSYRASVADFLCRLCWIYATKLPKSLSKREWTIGFRLPAPIGSLKLVVRANAGADAFIYSEVFEHQSYRVPCERPPATILDLGANIGLSAIYLARSFPGARLACVEPAPDNVRLLSRNLEFNGIAAEIITAAVDVEDGTVWMQRSPRDYGHTIAPLSTPAGTPRFEARALTVASVLRRLGWSRVGLVKMDIEGHETVLLAQNCDWLCAVDALCLEYHHACGEAKLTSVADRFGFLPPQLLPSGLWLLSR